MPRMISTRGILSTGEKKCMPMKPSGRDEDSASPVIGSVDVLDAKTVSSGITASVFWVTSALISLFSNTASIIRSHSARSLKSVVTVILSRTSAAASVVILPFFTLFSRNFSVYCLPLAASSSVESMSTTFMPDRALTKAIPDPIIPAPSMPKVVTFVFANPSGRARSLSADFLLTNKVRIMLPATGPARSSAK